VPLLFFLHDIKIICSLFLSVVLPCFFNLVANSSSVEERNVYVLFQAYCM